MSLPSLFDAPAGTPRHGMRAKVERLMAPVWRRLHKVERLVVPFQDIWTGSVARGQALVHAGNNPAAIAAALAQNIPPPGFTSLASFHSFSWLRDVAGLAGEDAQLYARYVTETWLDNVTLKGVASEPLIMGERLGHWLAHYGFLAATAPDRFCHRLIESIFAHGKDLLVSLPATPHTAAKFTALRGLIFACLIAPPLQPKLELALWLLNKELSEQLNPDGGQRERSPRLHALVLQELLDTRAALVACGHEPSTTLQEAIAVMARALRFYRSGEGGLVLFNGTHQSIPAYIESLLLMAGAPRSVPQVLANTGFMRLSAQKTVVVLDVGVPVTDSAACHFGLLGFEMAVGKERVVVNCGAHTHSSPSWRQAEQATAAHSSVTLDDNQAVTPETLPTLTIRCTREKHKLQAAHNGYSGAEVQRDLQLSEAGDCLQGVDTIVTQQSSVAVVRFHIHPKVQVSATAGGSVLLRLASGTGWRFIAMEADVTIEDSVYRGVDGETKKTTQLVIRKPLAAPGGKIIWAFSREDRRPPTLEPSAALPL